MAAKRMAKVRHNKMAPREKSQILEKICDDEQLNIIKSWIKKGAVFIVLGSEFTHTGEFYKGLRQLMYSPVYVGAGIYDSHYKFQDAFDRPHIQIGLNDPINESKIDNIKKLDRYRNRTLYTCKYDDGEAKTQQKTPMDVIGMFINVGNLPEESAETTNMKTFDISNKEYPNVFWNQLVWRWVLWMPALSADMWKQGKFAYDSVDYLKCFTTNLRDVSYTMNNIAITPLNIVLDEWNTDYVKEAYMAYRCLTLNYDAFIDVWMNENMPSDYAEVFDNFTDSYKELMKLFMQDIWRVPLKAGTSAVVDELMRLRENIDNIDKIVELDRIFDIEVKD